MVIANDFPNKDNSYITNIFVKEQVIALSKLVETITVLIAVPRGIEFKRKTQYEDYKIGENITVHFIKYFNPLFPLTYKRLRQIWVWREFRAVMQFLKARQISFDLIHAHYTWPSGVLAVELKKIFNVPVVLTEHTHLTLYERVRQKDRLYFNTWKTCDAIIRVTKKDLLLFAEFNSNVHAVPNGFSLNRIKPQQKDSSRSLLNLPSDKKIVFSLARLFPEKGFQYLIQAMAIISDARNDVLCFIGGTGPLKNELQDSINRLGLQNKVKLIGFVPDDKLTYWMHASDIFVLPSLSEGNPTVMFEALGAGLPFVGTAVGGVSEIIMSDDFGLLCPPKIASCLAGNILIALSKEWDSKKISDYSLYYTWDNIASKILEVYRVCYNRKAHVTNDSKNSLIKQV